jgi:hypothetical protein
VALDVGVLERALGERVVGPTGSVVVTFHDLALVLEAFQVVAKDGAGETRQVKEGGEALGSRTEGTDDLVFALLAALRTRRWRRGRQNMTLERTIQRLQDEPTPRQEYLDYVQRVLAMAIYKYEHKQTKNSERIAWGRLVINAIAAGNSVLKDQDLDDLQERIQQLELKLQH